MSITAEKAQDFGSDAQTITCMEVTEMVRKQHKNIVEQTPFLLCLQGVKFVADDIRVL